MADSKHRKHEKRESYKHEKDSRKRRSPCEEKHAERLKREDSNREDESRSHHHKRHNDRPEKYREADDHKQDERKRRKRSPSYDPDHKNKQQRDNSNKNDKNSDHDRSRHRDRHRNDNKRDDQSGWDDDRPRDSSRHKKESNNRREWDKAKYGDQDANEDNQQFGATDDGNKKKEETVNKEEPSFALSGKLTEYTNTYKGVVIKYNEPAEARKPKTKWRFYPFKGDKALPLLQLHRQSAFLLGRDRQIADIPIDHPSCSSQHAVLQFRLVEYERPDGAIGKKVKPYIIDLESTNGTFVNNNKVDARRYTELLEKDVIKFGFSSREYVILHEKSKADEDDGDDVGLESGGFGGKDVKEEEIEEGNA